jgi:hypothetical protein
VALTESVEAPTMLLFLLINYEERKKKEALESRQWS